MTTNLGDALRPKAPSRPSPAQHLPPQQRCRNCRARGCFQEGLNATSRAANQRCSCNLEVARVSNVIAGRMLGSQWRARRYVPLQCWDAGEVKSLTANYVCNLRPPAQRRVTSVSISRVGESPLREEVHRRRFVYNHNYYCAQPRLLYYYVLLLSIP